MRLKEGVDIGGITSEIVLALFVINSIFTRYAKECVVTSVMDGKHMEKSKHYFGEAVDIRTNNLTAEEQTSIFSDITKALGKDFDVILEDSGEDNQHFHVEWDKK